MRFFCIGLALCGQDAVIGGIGENLGILVNVLSLVENILQRSDFAVVLFDIERSRVGLTALYIGNRNLVGVVDFQAVAAAGSKVGQLRIARRAYFQALIGECRIRSVADGILRAVDEELAVERNVGVIVNLVNGLIQLFLNRLTVLVRIGIVGCVDGFFFQRF